MINSLAPLLEIDPSIGLAERDKKVIEDLKQSGLPVVIYGAGEVARLIAKKLAAESIDFVFAADADFAGGGGTHACGN